MATGLKKIASLDWVQFVDDERDMDHSIIVTLHQPYCFKIEAGCGVRGFDTVADAVRGTRAAAVYKQEVAA